jgi:hypothetical protein
MNRWIVMGLVGLVSVATGCGDDSVEGTGGGSGGGAPSSSSGDPTSTTTGDGGAGGGTGGADPGSGGAGGNLLGGCAGPGECGADERCEFRDGLCGAGEPGTCVPRNDACGDTGNERTCLCSGAIVDADFTCDDDDADVTGACDVDDDSFACGDAVCERIPGAFCRVTADDTGGADYFGCGETVNEACQDVPTCECLAAEIDGCGGTCEDGDDGATVRCPGG